MLYCMPQKIQIKHLKNYKLNAAITKNEKIKLQIFSHISDIKDIKTQEFNTSVGNIHVLD